MISAYANLGFQFDHHSSGHLSEQILPMFRQRIRSLLSKTVKKLYVLFFKGDVGTTAPRTAEEKRMEENLHAKEDKVEELFKNWTSKWKETQKIIEV